MHVIEIRVLPVNTAPSFSMLTSGVLSCYDSPILASSVVGNVSPGPYEDQNVTFHVALIDGNASLFSTFPTVDTDGTMHFVISKTSWGSAQVSITLYDDGDGGQNRSSPSTITVQVEEFLDLTLSTVVYIVDEDDSLRSLQLLVRHALTLACT